jgi:hypothetical protein
MHKGKFAQALLEIPCRLFPPNTVTFIETEKQLITGIFEDDCSVMLYSEKDKFSVGLSLSVNCDVSLLVEPNDGVLIKDLEKELEKSAGGLIEVDEGDGVLVSINCIPDKTIKEMLDMLVITIKKAVNKCKVGWIKDAKQLVKEFEAA